MNGIRAIVQKTFLEDMKRVDADVICLQETKASEQQVSEALVDLKGYHVFAHEAEKKGYSGTAILSKEKPISVFRNIGIEEHDTQGRVICAEFKDFFVVSVYVPNSGSELLRLPYRKTWDQAFLAFLKNLEKSKPVIACGDFNVAHKDLDLARPKPNYNKSAGYMQEEIDGMDAYTANGFVDTFRFSNPDKIKYTWWSYRGGARDKNVGWRIDYFLVSQAMQDKIKESFILNDVYGSDHCPVGIDLE